MNKLTGFLVGLAFVAGTAGLAAAQTAPKADEKKVEKPADAAKPAETKVSEPKAAVDVKPAEKKMAAKMANGTVKSAAADSIVVAGKDKGKDAEWTFAVTEKTKIKKAGKDITAKDLAAGDAVNVRYIDHDGKATASAITVRPAKKEAAAKDAAKQTKPAEAKPADTKPADVKPADAKPADKK